MKILVLNCGSSSVKYQLFDMQREVSLLRGTVQRIGEAGSKLEQEQLDPDGAPTDTVVIEDAMPDHGIALQHVNQALQSAGALRNAAELGGIGHRVVHGGQEFRSPSLIDDDVIEGIRRVTPLAPLHNPANLLGIEMAMHLHSAVPQVAVFDTSFHASLPPHAYRYGVGDNLYEEHGVRRYGFHGVSHQYVARQAAQWLQLPLDELNAITLHLGNGASATAIQHGRSIDTSMGMTPLEGLLMGSRSGDLDPAIPLHLVQQTGRSVDEVADLLNRNSGLQGLCGANDMREVHRLADAGDERAVLALEIYCYRIIKYVGAYATVLGAPQALVFTGGVGENDARLRARVCAGLGSLGIRIDPEQNLATMGRSGEIQGSDSTMKVLVIPTDEEREIATQTMGVIRAEAPASGRSTHE